MLEGWRVGKRGDSTAPPLQKRVSLSRPYPYNVCEYRYTLNFSYDIATIRRKLRSFMWNTE